ncbi:MAG: sigma-70 family RNA polymerase sigma factor [Ruminococcus sp.]|nr:sigma-70 family RNA polymerase sigma factor [Ruminococcus sp.]
MDKEYYESCVRLYEKTVFHIAVNYCKSYHDAEDITQEVFLRFYNKIKQPPNVEQAKFLLIRMAVNISINHTRSAWKTKVIQSDNDELLDKLYKGSTTDSERSAEVLSAVRELPVKYRSVIYLYYYEDMQISEISRVLKIKETTIQTQLYRAREILRKKLGEVPK